MKSLLKPCVVLSAIIVSASQAMAASPSQPYIIPATGDIGAYSVQDQTIGSTDPYLARAYDNFTLSNDYFIDGFSWTGVYAEPLPNRPSDTDFIVQIWGSAANGLPDTVTVPRLTYRFEGGSMAGMGGSDLSVTGLGHRSRSTAATPGGGAAFHYDASIAPTMLEAGDYWISIVADQRFDSVGVFDPEWQWHLGDGPGDGFSLYDRATLPFDAAEQGVLQAGKDLAFSVSLVPEPSAAMLALIAVASLSFLRRARD